MNESIGEATMLDGLDLDETFTGKMRLLHAESFRFAQPEDLEADTKGPRKMNAFETYIALIKGYCALMILVLPRAFSRGGYVFSPITLLISGSVQLYAALLLVSSGQKLKL